MLENIQSILKPLAFEAIGKGLQNITGASSSLDAFKTPVGDPGLFGPQSGMLDEQGVCVVAKARMKGAN